LKRSYGYPCGFAFYQDQPSRHIARPTLHQLIRNLHAGAAAGAQVEHRRDLRFRQRFNAMGLAAKRTGITLRDRLGRHVLREGDLLLIQAPLDALRDLQQSRDLAVLDQLDDDLPTAHRKHLAVAVMVAVMVAVLLLSGLGVMPLVAAVLLGVGVLVIGGCLDAGSALRAIRCDVNLLLGGLYSLSVALQ
jgi:di/tricarboxylate transporter